MITLEMINQWLDKEFALSKAFSILHYVDIKLPGSLSLNIGNCGDAFSYHYLSSQKDDFLPLCQENLALELLELCKSIYFEPLLEKIIDSQ